MLFAGKSATVLPALGALVLAAVTPIAAMPSPAAAATVPTTAVAMGDSFISGEGIGDYVPVLDSDGVTQRFPGWSATNSNAYFCHRSDQSSIFQANLPGIEKRFNIACSGAQPHDLAAASDGRERGRHVAAQLDQLRTIGRSHDIDLVLLGIGSNNSTFTFGKAVSLCANRFIADAWTGWWEIWAYLNGPVEQAPCTADELATEADIDRATSETIDSVRQVLKTLDEIDADGQHRIVLQDYTNPLPLDFAAPYRTEDGRDDTRDKFRALGAERYAAGCPAHRASLAAGHTLSAGLGRLVKSVHAAMSTEFPGTDLVYLNVQHAFDGARLCEVPDSPVAALTTPLRLHDGPTSTVVDDLSGYDKLDIQELANTCVRYYQTCQESWHPTAAGHAVLGRCLAAAASTAARDVTCTRSTDGTITTSGGLSAPGERG